MSAYAPMIVMISDQERAFEVNFRLLIRNLSEADEKKRLLGLGASICTDEPALMPLPPEH